MPDPEIDGRIETDRLPRSVHLRERDGFLAGECDGDDGDTLTVDAVRDLVERSRR